MMIETTGLLLIASSRGKRKENSNNVLLSSIFCPLSSFGGRNRGVPLLRDHDATLPLRGRQAGVAVTAEVVALLDAQDHSVGDGVLGLAARTAPEVNPVLPRQE